MPQPLCLQERPRPIETRVGDGIAFDFTGNPRRRADDRDALTTRFQLLQVKKTKRIASIPKVRNLSMGVSSVAPPSKGVLAKLGSQVTLLGWTLKLLTGSTGKGTL